MSGFPLTQLGISVAGGLLTAAVMALVRGAYMMKRRPRFYIQPQPHRRVVRVLAWLLPLSEARAWADTQRGFLADMHDPRERHAYLRSLILHMPWQVWTSWAIHLHRRYKLRELVALTAVLDFTTDHPDERPAWSALLTLGAGDLRALWQGSPVWLRSTHGRLIDVRLRHRPRRTR